MAERIQRRLERKTVDHVRLNLDDLKEVADVLGAASHGVEISDDEFRYSSFEDLERQRSGRIKRLSLTRGDEQGLFRSVSVSFHSLSASIEGTDHEAVLKVFEHLSKKSLGNGLLGQQTQLSAFTVGCFGLSWVVGLIPGKIAEGFNSSLVAIGAFFAILSLMSYYRLFLHAGLFSERRPTARGFGKTIGSVGYQLFLIVFGAIAYSAAERYVGSSDCVPTPPSTNPAPSADPIPSSESQSAPQPARPADDQPR